MDAVTKWVPWAPRVGDVKPDVYQFRIRGREEWETGSESGSFIDAIDIELADYQIPGQPLDIDLPYLLKKSAKCSPETQAAVIALKAKFADEIGKLIADDEAVRKGGAA